MSAMDHLGIVVVALLVLSIHTSQGCDGENEEMALMPTPERTCDNYESSSPGGSKSGCVCSQGTVRHPSGTCVQPSECKACRPDEEYLNCGSACPKTCQNYNENQLCTAQCVPGCFCRAGTVRAADGSCVTPDRCPSAGCGRNEELRYCGQLCENKCVNGAIAAVPCKHLCKQRECGCKDGFVRNAQGVCTNSCLSTRCQLNEELRVCGKSCEDKCVNGVIKAQPCGIMCPAEKSCGCKPGFARNDKGFCVNYCPNNNVCPRNEYLKQCGRVCEKTCREPNPQVCPLYCTEKPECSCRDGFYRNRDGRCVRLDQCRPETCGANQTYTDCGSSCPRTCSPVNDSQIMCPAVCVPGCFCGPEYVSSSLGCILPEDCPVAETCGYDEDYTECGTACPRTCANRNIKISCIDVCVEGCFCKPGLVRNEEGRCVEPSQCPPVCKSDEEYQSCGTACPKTCKNYNQNVPCTLQCVEGCFCKKGTVRADDGSCVVPEKCPPVCRADEEYLSCGTACPKTCKNYNQDDVPCTLQCVEGCFCKEGTVRAEDGSCVVPEKCPPVCPKNEKYTTCGSSCPDTCDNLGTYRKCTAECVIGCVCEEGFVRNKDGCCVNPRECPDKGLCSTNEEYQTCSKKSQLSCSNYTQTPPPCSDECFHGCVCKEGYVRDVHGACIDPSNCPPQQQCTKANEEYQECGTACPKTCENYTNGTVCAEYCVPGCFCKSGYVRNKVGNCVKPNDCPNLCPNEHEHYACGSACDNECATLGEPCPIINVRCNDKCYCDKGYARDSCGTCIPECMCPPKE